MRRFVQSFAAESMPPGLPEEVAHALPTFPDRYNIARDTVDRHAAERPEAVALIHEDETGRVQRLTFADVRDRSMRLANVLSHLGLSTGDRVAMLLEGQIVKAGSFDEVFATPDPRIKSFYDYNFTQQANA